MMCAEGGRCRRRTRRSEMSTRGRWMGEEEHRAKEVKPVEEEDEHEGEVKNEVEEG